MENASKALIIAGAILVAILLISVGIMVFNSVNKPLDEVSSEANSQAAQIFNSKFLSYAGKNKTARDLRNLLSIVQASNASDPNHQILLRAYVDEAGTDIYTNGDSDGNYLPSNFFGEVDNDKTYKIVMWYALDGLTLSNSIMQRDNGGFTKYFNNKPIPSEKGYICVINIFFCS